MKSEVPQFSLRLFFVLLPSRPKASENWRRFFSLFRRENRGQKAKREKKMNSDKRSNGKMFALEIEALKHLFSH